jgi:hypothetical protein
MQTVSLTGEDLDMLMFIYRKRLRFFIQVCIGLLGMSLYTSFKAYCRSANEPGISSNERIVLSSVVEMILFVAMTVVYRFRIARLKRDAANGLKEVLVRNVTGKQHFEHTNQFFISLNDPDHMHYELDYEAWHALGPGDTFVLYKAPLSGYVFAFNGKYTII